MTQYAISCRSSIAKTRSSFQLGWRSSTDVRIHGVAARGVSEPRIVSSVAARELHHKHGAPVTQLVPAPGDLLDPRSGA